MNEPEKRREPDVRSANGKKRSRLKRAIRTAFYSTVIFTGLAISLGVAWVAYWEKQTPGDNTATLQQAVALRAAAQGDGLQEPDRWPDYANLLEDYQLKQERFAATHAAPTDENGLENRPWVPDALAEFYATSSQSERASGAEFLNLLIESGVLKKQEVLSRSRHFERPFSSPSLLQETYPELSTARRLARADRAYFLRCWQTGGSRDLEAAQAFEWMLALGRVSRQQFGSINSLVGMAIQAMAISTVRDACIERPLRADALAFCLDAIKRQLDEPSAELALLSERITALDAVHFTFSDNGNGDGYFLTSGDIDLGFLTGGKPRRIATGKGFFLAGKKETAAKIEELIEVDLIRARKRPRDRKAKPDIDPVDALPWRFNLLQILMPASNKFVAAADQLLAEMEGTRALLGVELFRARNGKLPDSLESLTPAILTRMPGDPFTTNGLRYVKSNPETGSDAGKYLLYSVGFDCEDNLGKMNSDAPFTSLNGSKSGRGFDFAFTTPSADFVAYLKRHREER